MASLASPTEKSPGPFQAPRPSSAGRANHDPVGLTVLRPANSLAGVQLLNRALEILEHLRGLEHPAQVSALLADLGMSRSNGYRILGALERAGFVSRDSRGTVELGLRYLDFALPVNARLQRQITPVALPSLQALTASTGETSLLTVRTGVYAMCVLSVDSPHPIRLSYSFGHVLPLYAGASGKVMLPWLPKSVSAAVVDAWVAQARPTERTTRRAQLDTELDSIRAARACTTTGEVDKGATGVAAPILLGSRSKLFGAVSVAGPSTRLQEHRLPTITVLVQKAAAVIADSIQQGGSK